MTNSDCQKCGEPLNKVNHNLLKEIASQGINTYLCLNDHIEKSRNNKDEWLKIVTFFLELKLWVIEKQELDNAKKIAFGLPKLFYIYCLLPYVHEGMEYSTDPDYKDLGNKEFFSVIAELTSSLIAGCDNNKSINNGLIDDIKRLIEHYSRHDKGEMLLDRIIEGFCNTRKSHKSSNDNLNFSFEIITDLRQAYWSGRKPKPITTKNTHKTIRINGLPFAESAYIYYLSECASELGINLEIIDVPWNEVGLALLTERIDIAVHNDSLLREQLPNHRRLAQNRILYCSDTILEYKNYFRLTHKVRDNIKKPCIALVIDSDHHLVFIEWLNENRETFLNDINYPLDQYKSNDDLILPVSNPDLAVAEFLDGGVAECLVGGIHNKYLCKEFNSEVNSRNLDRTLPINVFFATLVNSEKNARNTLLDIISSWRQVEKNWKWIRNGMLDEVVELKKRIVAHVNRQPHRAFIPNFDALHDLLAENNELKQTDYFISDKQIDGW